jgi:hypothetical protein
MPLIATLVPAYKPDFLVPLFAGLRTQTLRDFRVIVSDDSPGATITDALRSGRFDALIAGLDLTVVRGPCSPLKNHQHLLDIWAHSTPLIHLLMDDDVVYPDFYRAHAELHARQRLSASVSLRWLTSAGGEPFATLPLPGFVMQSVARSIEIDTALLFDSTVARSENWLGELSNMVFTAEAAGRFPRPPAAGVSYFGLPDVGLLLNAASTGPICVLRDHLSGFRQHAGQTTANTQSANLKIAHLAWVAFALQARRDGHLDDARALRGIAAATQRCLQVYAGDPVMQRYFAIVQAGLDDVGRFETEFATFWQALLRSCPDACDWPATALPTATAPIAAPTMLRQF